MSVGRKVRNWGLAWLALAALGVLIFQPSIDAGSRSKDVVGHPDGQTVDIRAAAEHDLAPGARQIPHLPLREPPASVQFEFDPTLSEGLQVEIRGAVGLAAAYFEATDAGPLPEITLVASADPSFLIEKLEDHVRFVSPVISEEWWDQFQGFYFDQTVYLRANWEDDGYGLQWLRPEVLSLVVHKLAHAVHHYASGFAFGDPAGIPDWFSEGAAEVEAQTALEAFGFEAFASGHDERVLSARQIVRRLESSEPITGDTYILGFLAVARVTATGDLSRMRDVFAWVGAGHSFDSAFAGASGQSVADFVAEFEEVRARNFPTYRGRISGHARLTGSRTSGLIATACSDEEVCSTAQVARDGSFTLVVSDGRYRLEFMPVTSPQMVYGPSVYYSLDGPVLDYEDATVFPVFGDTVEGFELEIPSEMFEE